MALFGTQRLFGTCKPVDNAAFLGKCIRNLEKEISLESDFPKTALETSFAEAIRIVPCFSLGNATFKLNGFLVVSLLWCRSRAGESGSCCSSPALDVALRKALLGPLGRTVKEVRLS